MILFFLLTIAAGLLGLIIFQTSVLLSILAIVCCTGGLVYSFIGPSRKKLVSTALLLAGLVCCILAGEKTDLIGGYQKDLRQIQKHIAELNSIPRCMKQTMRWPVWTRLQIGPRNVGTGCGNRSCWIRRQKIWKHSWMPCIWKLQPRALRARIF